MTKYFELRFNLVSGPLDQQYDKVYQNTIQNGIRNETQLEIVCQNAGPSGPHRNHKTTSSPFIATGKSSSFFGASISQDEEQHSMTRHPESAMVWMNVVTADESARMIDESARNIFLCTKDYFYNVPRQALVCR